MVPNLVEQIPPEVWDLLIEAAGVYGKHLIHMTDEWIKDLRKPKTRRDLLAEFITKRNDRVIATVFARLESAYPDYLGNMATLMLDGEQAKGRIFVLPRFLLNELTLDVLQGEIGQSADFKSIEPDETTRGLMLLLEVAALDKKLTTACQSTSLRAPFENADGWAVIGLNTTFNWDNYYPGHYYLIREMLVFIKVAGERLIRPSLLDLETKLARLSSLEIKKAHKRWEDWLENRSGPSDRTDKRFLPSISYP